MKQLQQKQQKLQLRVNFNMMKQNNWRKNHLTLLFDFTNNLTPLPIQWHTNTREATGRQSKGNFMISPTSFNVYFILFLIISFLLLKTAAILCVYINGHMFMVVQVFISIEQLMSAHNVVHDTVTCNGSALASCNSGSHDTTMR